MKEFDWVSEKNISGKFLVAAKYMIWNRNSCLVLAVLLANYTYIYRTEKLSRYKVYFTKKAIIFIMCIVYSNAPFLKKCK